MPTKQTDMPANTIKRVEYFYLTIKDQPGEAYRILSRLAELGINLQAMNVVPIGPSSTQMAIFPDNALDFQDIAEKAGLNTTGPYPAILVQGNDRVGALAEIHQRLFQAGVNVYAASGVSSGQGYFGYLIYIRPESFVAAGEVLGI